MSVNIRKPTSTSAGAVTTTGMSCVSGASRIATRNSTPVTTDANPVLPPSATPAALSM